MTVAVQGDFGKPRPAVVIQADVLNQLDTDSTIVALMTSTVRDAPLLRLTIEPDEQNGLQQTSQIMMDKLLTVRRDRVGKEIGSLSERQLVQLNRLLAMVIGIS